MYQARLKVYNKALPAFLAAKRKYIIDLNSYYGKKKVRTRRLKCAHLLGDHIKLTRNPTKPSQPEYASTKA